MTSASVQLSSPRWPDRTAGERPLPFWPLHVLWWSAYGVLLMVPWLGQYPVLLMLPNKIVVGGTGLLVSAGLRQAYRAVGARTHRPEVLLGAVAIGSALGGVAWSVAMLVLLGGDVGHQLFTLGSLGSGIPAFAGAPYHALVMLAWSLAYVTVVSTRQRPFPRPSPATTVNAAPTAHGASSDLILRDGRRSVVVAAQEVDWIGAEGDYVRVYLGPQSLLIRDTMSRLETVLSTDLVRIHRSTIINVSRVRETVALPNRELDVILRNGVRVRASRTYADRLRAALGMDGDTHSAVRPARQA